MDITTLRAASCIVLLAVSQTNLSFADDLRTNEANRSYVFSGMRAEREKLTTGQVAMRGERVVRVKGEDDFITPIRFEIAFDKASSSYRYKQACVERFAVNDDEESSQVDDNTSKGKTASGADWQSIELGGTLVRTTEYDLHQALNSTVVTRLAPGAAENTLIYEPDVLCIGLLDLLSFQKSVHFQEALTAYEKNMQLNSTHRSSSDLWQLKYHARNIETEMWVDETNGMTPIRLTVRDLREGLKEQNRPELISTTEVGWKSINNNWVPMSLRMSRTSPNGSFESYDLTAEWSHVNELLDPKIFTAAGMADSANAIVMDARLGPILVEQVNPKPLPVFTPNPVKSNTPSRLGWIVLGHLIAGGGFAWWYYRRRARRQSA